MKRLHATSCQFQSTGLPVSNVQREDGPKCILHSFDSKNRGENIELSITDKSLELIPSKLCWCLLLWSNLWWMSRCGMNRMEYSRCFVAVRISITFFIFNSRKIWKANDPHSNVHDYESGGHLLRRCDVVVASIKTYYTYESVMNNIVYAQPEAKAGQIKLWINSIMNQCIVIIINTAKWMNSVFRWTRKETRFCCCRDRAFCCKRLTSHRCSLCLGCRWQRLACNWPLFMICCRIMQLFIWYFN